MRYGIHVHNFGPYADPRRLVPSTVLAIPPMDVVGAPPGGR